MKRETSQAQCITANSYACLELSAHNLVLAARSCRDNSHPEQFLVKHLGSQDVEALFRLLRSMTTMNETQTDLTFKELGEKLRRVHMCQQIEYRNNQTYKFPGHKPDTARKEPLAFPTDAEIESALAHAQVNASAVLESLGMPRSEQQFTICITATGDPDWEDLIESDESDTEQDQVHQVHETSPQVVNARDIFDNFSGTIELPETTSDKHVYLIRDDEGTVRHVKKESVVWMLTEGKSRATTARASRFRHKTNPRATRQKDDPAGSSAMMKKEPTTVQQGHHA